jgi:TDG/mug DNA glycosylase family protein
MFSESFPPIISPRSKILILGTMPGRQSLIQQQYYANSQNAFWRIMFGMFGNEVPAVYDKRIEFLHSKKIAVWDVLKSCHREGSLDEDILDEVPNDFPALFKQYPNIKAIVFNGNNPHKYFKKYVGMNTAHDYYHMPSTSPANRTKRFEQKLELWQAVKSLL